MVSEEVEMRFEAKMKEKEKERCSLSGQWKLRKAQP
jgi:hypothetical protein